MVIRNWNRILALLAVLFLALATASVAAQTYDGSDTIVRTITWTNGHRYHGQTLDGNRHGYGVMTWADGDRYEGEWRHDKVHGRGVFTWADGDRYEGDFRNGERHGEGRFIGTDGWIEEGDWRNGEIVTFRSIPPFTLPQKVQQSTKASRQSEYWGAFAAQLGAYGLSWNYPSRNEALRSAFSECSKRVTSWCDQEHDLWHTFSTFDEGEGANYWTKCFAVGEYDHGGSRLVTGEGGDTKQEAMDAVRRQAREWGFSIRIVEAVCNER